MGRKWHSSRIVSVVLSLMGAAVFAGLPQTAHAFTPIATGDLVVSNNGKGTVDEYTPSGTFVQALTTANTPTGSAFDGHGNLYVTEFWGNDILRVDATTGAVTVFSNDLILADGTAYHNPESVAFNAGFTKLYVSEVNRIGTPRGIHVVDASTGKGLDFLPLNSSSGSSAPGAGQGQSDWLAFNASDTLFMTNENSSQGIMQVDQVTKDIVSPSFVPNLPNTGYAISFDKNGDLWVGDTNTILEYSPAGTLLKTITNPNFSVVFAAVFNPAGDTFYAGDLDNGNVYIYDLSGTLQHTFNVGGGVGGLSVAGASLANQPPPPPPPPPSEQSISATGTTIDATEGQLFTGPVASFTDPAATATSLEYAASVAWGDGSNSPADGRPVTITGPVGGPFTVSGSHTYVEEGTHSVIVTITDVDTATNTATATSTATVTDASLSASCAAVSTSVQSFNGPTATFTDAASPSGTLSDFSATIHWGDGSSSAGTVAGPDGGPYSVSGSHTYSSTGPFAITTTINDVGGSTATTSACSVLAFAFAPGGGSFVIGNNNSANGTSVTFWAARWSKLNSLSGGSAPASFKGFAETPATPTCGAGWSADPGNSTPPPAGPLPAFMGVIVASSASKSDSTVSGNTVHIVVVHTIPGYQGNPGHPGEGTVVAQVC